MRSSVRCLNVQWLNQSIRLTGNLPMNSCRHERERRQFGHTHFTGITVSQAHFLDDFMCTGAALWSEELSRTPGQGRAGSYDGGVCGSLQTLVALTGPRALRRHGPRSNAHSCLLKLLDSSLHLLGECCVPGNMQDTFLYF